MSAKHTSDVDKKYGMLRTPSNSRYENIVIVSKRARQIFSKDQEELKEVLEELGPSYSEDTLDMARIALVDKYERKEKPIYEAKNECNKGELLYKYITLKESE